MEENKRSDYEPTGGRLPEDDFGSTAQQVNLSEKQNGGPGLKEAMKLYIFVFVLLLLVGSLAQGLHFEFGMIVTQWVLILLPALWFWRRYGVDSVVFARLYPLKVRFIPVIVLLSLSFWLLNMVLASGMIVGLMEMGYQPIVVIEPPRTVLHYLAYLAVLSLSAGICEEVLFRGAIMPAIEGRGLIPAIIFSSFLFALFHGSFTSLISTFMLGVVIAVVVIKTGSLWGGILYHMLNNFYAATYLYAAGFIDTAAAVEVEAQDLWAGLPILILSLGGAWLGLRLLHNKSGAEPLLKGYRGSWMPRGWFGGLMVVALVFFLFLAVFEMVIGFGLLDLSAF